MLRAEIQDKIKHAFDHLEMNYLALRALLHAPAAGKREVRIRVTLIKYNSLSIPIPKAKKWFDGRTFARADLHVPQAILLLNTPFVFMSVFGV